jgi:ribonuclease VapC
MVVDSSALIAILRSEPEGDAFRRSILRAEVRLLSAVSKLEASMVAIGMGDPAGALDLDDLLRELTVVVVAFDEHQADIARDAFARYGKGRHPAGLNFGDCAAYALAIAEAEPLLFKGTDFGATDVAVVGTT